MTMQASKTADVIKFDDADAHTDHVRAPKCHPKYAVDGQKSRERIVRVSPSIFIQFLVTTSPGGGLQTTDQHLPKNHFEY